MSSFLDLPDSQVYSTGGSDISALFESSQVKMTDYFDVGDDALRLTHAEIQGLAEGNFMPQEVDALTDKLMHEWEVTDAHASRVILVRLLTYLIENAPSPRGEYDKVFEVDGRHYNMMAVKKVIGRDIRRWFRDSRIVVLCFRIMKNNPDLAQRMAKSWGVYDQRLWPFCFETSLLLPAEYLSDEDRNLLSAKRGNTIEKAGPYVRADVDRAKVDNSHRSTGASDHAEAMTVHRRPAGISYD